MRRRNVTWVSGKLIVAGVIAVVAPLAMLPASQAAVTIGSDLGSSSNISVGCTNGEATCADWQTALPGHQVTSPINGVVVRWRVLRGGLSGAMRLRVVRPVGGTSYLAVATSAQVAPPVGTSTYGTRLPISAGDYVGLDRRDGGASGDVFRTAPGAGTYREWSPSVADNLSTGTFEYSDFELLMNADIEADVDGDGYGDESQDQCSTDASTQGQCPLAPASGAAKDTVAPILSEVSLTNKAFRAREMGFTGSRSPRGTTFNYTVSEVTTVTFTIERKAKGRKVGAICQKPKRKNRLRRRCTRYRRVGSLDQQASAGANQKPFSGKIGSTTLRKASYRATLVAVDAAGNASHGASVDFKIVAG